MRSATRAFIILITALLAAPSARADYADAAAYSAEHRGVALVVMVNGAVVFEDYPAPSNPWRRSPAAQTANFLASGSKSFSGIIAAAAVQDGLLRLDERVSDTITEWRDHPDLSRATVRELLSLTAGLPDISDRRHRAIAFDIAVQAGPVAQPGAEFIYGATSFQVFGALMSRKLAAAGRDPDPTVYLAERVLEPLGVSVMWSRASNGDAHLAGGARMSARDWARFGEFVRLGGRWNGRQLVDANALAACFEGSRANPAYGLTWWLQEPVEPGVVGANAPLRRALAGWDDPAIPDDAVMAAGAGNQRLYVIGSRGMVVARQASGVAAALAGHRSGWSDAEFLSALFAP